MSNYPINYASPESEDLPVQQKKIRCRQCGIKAYENLVICPNCGRELYEAAPRWLAWGIPALVAVLFLLVLTGVGGGNPVNGLRTGLESGWSAVSAFANKIEPRITVGGSPNVAPALNVQPNTNAANAVAVIPADQNVQGQGTDLPVENNLPDENAVVAGNIITAENAGVEQSPDAPPANAEVADARPVVPQQNGANGEPAVVIDTPTSTPAAQATFTSTPLPPTPVPPTALPATVAPTETPIALPTATNTPQQANSSENSASTTGSTSLTVSNIRATSVALTKTVVAASSPTTMPTPFATNTLAPALTNTPAQPSLPTATNSATPAPSATPVPSATPLPTATPTVEPITYAIQQGDTLLAIARRFDTTVLVLTELNGMSDEDVRRLRVGQEIRLPAQNQSSAAPSAPAAPAPTPRTYVIKAGDLPATIAQQFGITVDQLLAANNLTINDVTRLRIGQVLLIPAGAQSSGAAPAVSAISNNANYRLDAPVLRSPESGTPMRCSVSDNLVWNPVPFMAPADQFVMHLGFVSNVAQNGEQTITWVLELIREQNRTLWDMDSDYCALAPQEWGRQWRWYVQVIDENSNPVSPPSETWAFSWN